MAPAPVPLDDSEATCEGKALFSLSSWAGVPRHAGVGQGKQEEQEGSTGFPVALCGVPNTQSSGGTGGLPKHQEHPAPPASSFLSVQLEEKRPFQPERKEHRREGIIVNTALAP